MAANAQPVCTSWIRATAPTSNAALDRIRPEVHTVVCGEDSVEIRSAAISLYQFGILANPVNPGNVIQNIDVRIPRHPQPATGDHTRLSADGIGVFINGVPIANHVNSDSFEGRNLWHFDLNLPVGVVPSLLARLLSDGSKHSPIIGYALDGYPIYGPWGYANSSAGAVKRMRPGYRLRAIRQRTTWPDGTQLTPGQYGPPIDTTYPAGTFSEDYEYVEGSGDLDRFNGRFAITPEYPEGTYAYFLSTDAQGQIAFPYLLADQYYGHIAQYAPVSALLATRPGLTIHASTANPQAELAVSFSFEFAARELEFVHEKPIHLIIVSEDLADFSHVHPERGMGEAYRLAYAFPHGGRYRLYAEFTPPGEGPRVESLAVQVAGPPRQAAPGASAALQVELTHAPFMRAGTDQLLRFKLSTTKGLEPYLGAWGHFVVIEYGLGSFIHAHPLAARQAMPEPVTAHSHGSIAATSLPPDPIEVPIAFPHAGTYKLWAQFQRDGEVHVIPFVLRVQPSVRTVARTKLPKDAIRIHVGPAGFSPARIDIPEGSVSTLAITRDTQPNCANKIVIPELGITRDLPPGGTALIALPAMAARELKFGCGMGMYRGLLLVK